MEEWIRSTAQFNEGIDRVLFPESPKGARITHDAFVRANEVESAVHAIMEAAAPIPPHVALLYNLDALESSISNLHKAFNSALLQIAPHQSEADAAAQFMHCFAVKSCPVSYILHRAISSGLGLETASLNELRQSIRLNIAIFCFKHF